VLFADKPHARRGAPVIDLLPLSSAAAPQRFGCNRCIPWPRGLHLRRCAGCTSSRSRGATVAPRDLRAWRDAGLHPVRTAFKMDPPDGVSPARRTGDGASRHGRVGLAKVAAGQAEVQVPALGVPTGVLDPYRDDIRVARPDHALGLQPVQAGAHRALGQPGVTDQRGHRRERSAAVRPTGLARPTSTNLHALDGRRHDRPDRRHVERPRDRLNAHRAPSGQLIRVPGSGAGSGLNFWRSWPWRTSGPRTNSSVGQTMHAARPILRKNEPARPWARVTRQPGAALPPSPRGRPLRTANPLPQARSSLPARVLRGSAGIHDRRSGLIPGAPPVV
jgi:hypothetical protein